MMRLIDAGKLTDKVREAIKESESPWTHYGWVQKTIDEAETVDAEPVRKGKWISEHSGFGDCFYRCSECGLSIDAYFYDVRDYCPKCGARMVNHE